ncbi:MAG: hypothetical protein J2P55_14930, partial [Rhizobiales bacterium]|nr:hypothetical protein [Hyphomicrobiales bacterium]
DRLLYRRARGGGDLSDTFIAGGGLNNLNFLRDGGAFGGGHRGTRRLAVRHGRHRKRGEGK